MKSRFIVPILTSFILSLSSVAYAEVNFSGFGTLAIGKKFGDDEFNSVDGYGDSLTIEPDSFLGLQAIADIYKELDLTLQIKTKTDEGAWETDITWAFLSYDITDDWRVIAGRQRMPHYTYSDYLDVSYAYHWIEAPSEVYNAPYNSFNGISSLYTLYLGDFTLLTQLAYGEEPDDDLDLNGKTYDDIMGARLNLNYDWITVNAAYFEFEERDERTRRGVTEVIQGVLKSADFGVQIDYGDWLTVLEITSVDFQDIGDNRGIFQPWMISVGRRFGSVMPHITYGENRDLDTGPDENEDTSTPFYTLGFRWDFLPSASLKVEYSAEEDNDGNTGSSVQTAIVTAF